jgi:hypothetical protein
MARSISESACPVSKRVMAAMLGLALIFTALLAAAQEPGEPVELALPAPMGSLKTVPLMQELGKRPPEPLAAAHLGLERRWIM